MRESDDPTNWSTKVRSQRVIRCRGTKQAVIRGCPLYGAVVVLSQAPPFLKKDSCLQGNASENRHGAENPIDGEVRGQVSGR